MGGSGRKAIQLRQMLFPRQHQFRGNQGLGQPSRLVCHACGINADKDCAEDDGEPYARNVEHWQGQWLAGDPRQRIVEKGEKARHHDHERTQNECAGAGQGHGRNHDRSQKQHCERVLQAARQIEKSG